MGRLTHSILQKSEESFSRQRLRRSAGHQSCGLVDESNASVAPFKCYQANVTYPEGGCLQRGFAVPPVDIDEKMLAEAYYIRKDGETIYNVYNLLGGKDDTGPVGNRRN